MNALNKLIANFPANKHGAGNQAATAAVVFTTAGAVDYNNTGHAATWATYPGTPAELDKLAISREELAAALRAYGKTTPEIRRTDRGAELVAGPRRVELVADEVVVYTWEEVARLAERANKSTWHRLEGEGLADLVDTWAALLPAAADNKDPRAFLRGVTLLSRAALQGSKRRSTWAATDGHRAIAQGTDLTAPDALDDQRGNARRYTFPADLVGYVIKRKETPTAIEIDDQRETARVLYADGSSIAGTIDHGTAPDIIRVLGYDGTPAALPDGWRDAVAWAGGSGKAKADAVRFYADKVEGLIVTQGTTRSSGRAYDIAIPAAMEGPAINPDLFATITWADKVAKANESNPNPALVLISEARDRMAIIMPMRV